MTVDNNPPKLGELIRKWVFGRYGVPGLVGLALLAAAAYAYTNWDSLFFITVSIASGATNSDPTCATQSKLVESTIAAVSKDLKGEEFCQFRHYQTFGDVDGDGTDDFIVLFSVEGMEEKGNSHYDFMSVFLSGRKWQPITVKTGERGERDPISAEVRGRKIILETVVYRPSDAMCCPSGKGALVYEVSGSQLKLTAETQEQTGRSAPSAQGKTPAR